MSVSLVNTKTTERNHSCGVAELTAEGAWTSAGSGCSQSHTTASYIPLKSYLFFQEGNAADFPSLILHKSSDNGASILNFAEKSSQIHNRLFSLLYSASLFEIIPQTVALGEGVFVHSN